LYLLYQQSLAAKPLNSLRLPYFFVAPLQALQNATKFIYNKLSADKILSLTKTCHHFSRFFQKIVYLTTYSRRQILFLFSQMETDCQYLFVYGTLLDESNIYAAYLKENSRFYQKGRFKGKLFNIGNYPGAVVDNVLGTYVYGSIFLIDDSVGVLKELDDYEGFGDDFAQPNEFVRELVEVETEGIMLICWVYLYNHPVKGLPVIKSGRYR